MITPKLDTIADIPVGEYPGSFEEANEEGCENFLAQHPEFVQSTWNATALLTWLDKRMAPYTLKNLEVAYAAQQRAGLIEKRPPAPRPAPRKIVTKPVEGGSAVIPPTANERILLQKVVDSPKLSDHQRRARDEKLRRAAIASRLAHSHLRPGEDPKILI